MRLIPLKSPTLSLFLFMLFLATALSAPGMAQADDPLYGPEFTFTNKEMIDEGELNGDSGISTHTNQKYRDLWAKKVREQCPSCQVKLLADLRGAKYWKVTHPSGLWFHISLDPWVVEVQMIPMTLQQVKSNKELIDELIFQTAKEAGLTPHTRVGGGHIHMDLSSSFAGNALLFRNFFVDYQNHPELAMGALGMYPDNAPPLAILSQSARNSLIQVLKKFDQGDEPMTIQDLASFIVSRVYVETIMDWRPKSKYQALNLNRMASGYLPIEKQTLELRGQRPQKDAQDYIDMLELFEARLKTLQKLEHPLPYQAPTLTFNSKNLTTMRQIPDPQRVVDSFYDYVVTSGLSWERYRNLLPSELQTITPTELQAEICPLQSDHGPVNQTPSLQILQEL